MRTEEIRKRIYYLSDLINSCRKLKVDDTYIKDSRAELLWVLEECNKDYVKIRRTGKQLRAFNCLCINNCFDEQGFLKYSFSELDEIYPSLRGIGKNLLQEIKLNYPMYRNKHNFKEV